MRAAGWEMEDERVEYEEDAKRFPNILDVEGVGKWLTALGGRSRA